MAGGKKARGRPSSFTQAVADEICRRLSRGETLVSICAGEDMPATRTVSDWKKDHPSFAADFGRARDEGFDAIAEECLEIADTPREGVTVTEKPLVVEGVEIGVLREVKTDDMLGHRKLQIETRLKLLAKWDPRRYGDKLELDHRTPDGPIAITLIRKPEEAPDAG
jgi:hypothetical protein